MSKPWKTKEDRAVEMDQISKQLEEGVKQFFTSETYKDYHKEKEAEARRIEAERLIAEEAAEKERQAEEARQAAEQAAREAEEKEKQGYDTGITYDQLAGLLTNTKVKKSNSMEESCRSLKVTKR